MATNTYVALDKKTVTTAVSSIEFLSIPQGYTDLVVVANIFGNGSTAIKFRMNNDSTSSYSWTYIYGTASTNGSGRNTNQTLGLGYASGITQGSFILNFQNYSNSTNNKTVLCRGDDASNQTNAWVNLWRKTDAITRIEIFGDGQNFSVGSTFSLYGIAAEGTSTAPKATGGAIYSDSTYYYHAFGASGTFTPLQSLSADILCVAGGGGAGYYYGGGGGGGGVQYAASQSLTATGYTVTIGSGGASRSGSSAGIGAVGNDSSFSTLVIAKGGGAGNGATSGAATGGNGGSGGGAGGPGSSAFGGSAVAGTGGTFYGNAGGPTPGGGSGGGSGAAGASMAKGGDGTSAFSSWGYATGTGQFVNGYYYYAGGGESNGNYGGGGYGGGGIVNQSGLVNTGGGAGADGNGGGGGSGVVVIRYAK